MKRVVSRLWVFWIFSCSAGVFKEEATLIKSGLIMLGGIYVTYRLLEAAQPYIIPTAAQKVRFAQEKKTLEMMKSREAFSSCLLSNKGSTDQINGIPKCCSNQANDFLLKASLEEYKDMLERFKRLV